jgi:hypothetical protein
VEAAEAREAADLKPAGVQPDAQVLRRLRRALLDHLTLGEEAPVGFTRRRPFTYPPTTSRASSRSGISEIYTLEGRRIVHVEVFLERSHARQAAGLEE